MKKCIYLLAVIVLSLTALSCSKGKKQKEKEIPISHAVTEQKKMVVVIASFNNVSLCEKNLSSVFEQKYEAFRVVYIDDCSSDGTYEKVADLVEKNHFSDRFTLSRNEVRRGPAENLFRSIHSLQDEEIVVILDGDDWFSSDVVLKRLNEIYADPYVWMTYGSYMYYPSMKLGECLQKIPVDVLQSNSIRTYVEKGMITPHLKTFYAGLFKKIKLQDFLMDGKFFLASWDVACMIPLVEMAGTHARYVKEILYVNNRDNPLNEDKVVFQCQQKTDKYVRAQAPYKRLELLKFAKESQKADILVFSFDRPLQLYACLESMQRYLKDVGEVYVLYRVTDKDFARGYEVVKKSFPSVHFLLQSSDPHKDFKPLVLQVLAEGPSPYILFAVDDNIVKADVALSACEKALEESGAWGFYLGMGKNIHYCYMEQLESGLPDLLTWERDILAWQFSQGVGEWSYPNRLDMSLYKKETIRNDLEKIPFIHPNSLESNWMLRAKKKRVGLCFNESKIVNIPLNIVNQSSNRNMHSYTTKELQEKFDAGLKMDIAPIAKLCNRAPHEEYDPLFIERTDGNITEAGK